MLEGDLESFKEGTTFITSSIVGSEIVGAVILVAIGSGTFMSTTRSLFLQQQSTPVVDVVEEEFSMYQHHLCRINGKDNYSWCYNILFSILQQAMRQDPTYYMLYAALWLDQQWRLVSYLYYTKFARPGDKTYFRHINLNVLNLINVERGAVLIQGLLSLDDKDDDNCTVLIVGI